MAGNSLRDFLQGMSNSAASNVSAPVDGLAWLLRKAGVDVGDSPVGGSDWMRQRGLTAEPQNKLAGLLGESIGGVAPMLTAAKAPQIAGALLKGGENLAAPRTLNPQAGMALFDLSGLPNRGKELVQSEAENLATLLKQNGFESTVQHSGSAAGPSSYLNISDPETGRFFKDQVRLSGHSKGAFNSQGVWNVNSSEFGNVLDAAKSMREMGKSKTILAQEKAQELIASGVSPKSAYKQANDLFFK